MQTSLLIEDIRFAIKNFIVSIITIEPAIFFFAEGLRLPFDGISGFHIALANGISLAPFCHPHCGRYITTYYNSLIKSASTVFQ